VSTQRGGSGHVHDPKFHRLEDAAFNVLHVNGGKSDASNHGTKVTIDKHCTQAIVYPTPLTYDSISGKLSHMQVL
jgi:hypothetical protein